jgi:phosphoglycolate phosphatase
MLAQVARNRCTQGPWNAAATASRWRLALATGQNRRGVARNLAREEVGPELFISTVRDGPGKPHPSMLIKLCGPVTVAETTIMIDTTHDITMALNAGVPSPGRRGLRHTEENS